MNNLHIPTLQHLYTNIFPHLPNSAIKLYVHYYLSSQNSSNNNTIDLTQFCSKTNTSIQTAYRALTTLKQKHLIPQDISFINTYNPNRSNPNKKEINNNDATTTE